ncbi:hypothetical protein [Paenibacillus macerans]|uniref:hypothetical protein n=1 Tax=Paenibacillus macerans TaxID=44252 RepID=UPI003D311F3E
MSLLRFLLNGPLRRRIRMLQAKQELLANRLEELEHTVAAASFPDAGTRQRLSMSIGQSITLETAETTLRGTLVSIQHDSLDLIDEMGQHVLVPAARITAIRKS